jgi:hypothetical protein
MLTIFLIIQVVALFIAVAGTLSANKQEKLDKEDYLKSDQYKMDKYF